MGDKKAKAKEVGSVGSGVVSKVKLYTKAKKRSIENEEASVLQQEAEFQKLMAELVKRSPGNTHVRSKISAIPPLVALKGKLGSLTGSLKGLVSGKKKTKTAVDSFSKHGFLITPDDLKSTTKGRELGGDVVVKISKDKDKIKLKKKKEEATKPLVVKKTSAYMNDYNKYEYENEYENEYLNDYNMDYNDDEYDENNYNMDYGQYDQHYNDEYENNYNMDNGQYYANDYGNDYYVPQSYINSDYKVNAEMVALGIVGMIFACCMIAIIGCICAGIGFVIMRKMKQNVNIKRRELEEIEQEEDVDMDLDVDDNRQEQQLLV